MANIEKARQALMRRVLEGEGRSSRLERRAAFNNTDLTEPLRQLVDKVAVNASTINDQDIDRVRQSGLSEDQIFEMVVCAAIGQATRQYEEAKTALKAVLRR